MALGCSVEQAAYACLMSVSQIYNWIDRYEMLGLEGMRDRPRCGAPQRLARQRESEFVQRVLLCSRWRDMHDSKCQRRSTS